MSGPKLNETPEGREALRAAYHRIREGFTATEIPWVILVADEKHVERAKQLYGPRAQVEVIDLNRAENQGEGVLQVVVDELAFADRATTRHRHPHRGKRRRGFDRRHDNLARTARNRKGR